MSVLVGERPAGTVPCWLCDGSGELKIQSVFQSSRSSQILTDEKTERCAACHGTGYVPKEDQ